MLAKPGLVLSHEREKEEHLYLLSLITYASLKLRFLHNRRLLSALLSRLQLNNTLHNETQRQDISAAISDAAAVALIETQKMIQIVYAPPFFFTI